MFIKIYLNVCKDFRKCFQRIHLPFGNASGVYHTKKRSTAVLPKSISKPKTIQIIIIIIIDIMNNSRAVTARYFFRRSSITLWRFRPKSGYTNETCTQ